MRSFSSSTIRSAIFLPIPGIIWKRVVVTQRDRAPELRRRRARHHGERDLGPDPVDGEQQREELTLVRVGEAVELERVLTDVEICLDGRLPPALGGAKELASVGVRVNAIAPGFIDTDLTRSMPPSKFGERLASVGMGRIGQPEDVANVALSSRATCPPMSRGRSSVSTDRWSYELVREGTEGCTSGAASSAPIEVNLRCPDHDAWRDRLSAG